MFTDTLKESNALGSGVTTGSGTYDMQLTDHHLRLMRMRTTSDLEGIELGPELGRGSYGKVYKGASCTPSPAVHSHSLQGSWCKQWMRVHHLLKMSTQSQ